MAADDPYNLSDLARLASVTPRTIRYYISQGLLPSPAQVGTNARYGDRHLDRLRLIRLLQREHLPLAEIRSRLASLSDNHVAELARAAGATPPAHAGSTASEYIRSVLPAAASAPAPAPSVQAFRMEPRAERMSYARALPEPPVPDRSQWDRIALLPDVELHVRRPLTRHHNRLVDRLIATARQLFEEEAT
jgi:DNA-binding transcriptional MerR regulator